MADWREAFPEDSRASWERRWAEAAGVDAWEVAAAYRDTWRSDNRLPAARRLERHFLGEPLPDADGRAVEACVAAVRAVLRSAGGDRLRLYRGQWSPGWSTGHDVELYDRGLTAWTPDRAVATGHASRRRPGAVLTAEASVDQVAFAFDPSSDGEVVLISLIGATVVSPVP